MSKPARTKEEAMESIKVVVRCRPIARSELDKGFYQVVDVDRTLSAVRVSRPKSEGGTDDEPPRSFTFDYVYPAGISQKQLFQETARPIVESVLDGYNGTIFAYGQTGTGKTFTMEGDLQQEELRGIMPNTFTHIFEALQGQDVKTQFLVKASFIEVYMDDIYDLLSREGTRKKMELKRDPEKGVYIKDVYTEVAKDPSDLFRILREGQQQRQVGATEMNKGSSRSHSIFSIVVESSTENEDGTFSYRQGKLNLVDLAGSERQKKTHAEGARMDEAKAINLSLSALGNVIKALASNSGHVPFRDSKLTRLLEDSLGGNTKTVMVANIGPADYNYSETMSTLRYADRAKKIKNKPRVNEDPRDTSLRQAQEEIMLLKAQLLAKQQGLNAAGMSREELLRLAHNAQTQGGGSGGSGEVVEVVKVKVVDTGYRLEDLQRKVEEAQREEDDMVHKTEEEKQEILRRKAEAEAEYEQAQGELERRQQQLQAEEEDMARVRAALEEKQREVVSGGGHVEQAKRNKEELARVEQELARRRQEQERLESEAAARAEAQLLMEEHYTSAEAEMQALQRKTKALYSKYQERKEDMRQLVEEFDAERADLLETIQSLDRQIKLRSLMIESFMPYSFYQVIDRARRWDPYTEEWVLPGLEFSGNSVRERDREAKATSRQSQTLSKLIRNSERVLGAGAVRDVGADMGYVVDDPLFIDYMNVNNTALRDDIYMEYPPADKHQ